MENQSLRDIFYTHEGPLIHKWDHYFEIYERYFSKYRSQKVNILEIGVSQGGSLQLWKKYFGNQAAIYAIDINPACKQFEEENIRIFIGSQSDPAFLNEVTDQIPELDIIIDDGGHTMLQQKISFETLYPKVKEGGVYIVEDTHTSYWYEFHGGLRKRTSFIEYAKNLIDSLYEHHVHEKHKILLTGNTKHINSIHFYDSMVIFDKRKRAEAFHIRKGEESIPDYRPTDLKKKTILMKIASKLFRKKKHPFDINNRGKL